MAVIFRTLRQKYPIWTKLTFSTINIFESNQQMFVENKLFKHSFNVSHVHAIELCNNLVVVIVMTFLGCLLHLCSYSVCRKCF